MTEDNALDRAIDHVAHQITSGQPSRGFSSRVQERIEQPRRTVGWIWQVAAGMAVVAAIAYVSWPDRDRERPTAPIVVTGPATERPPAPRIPATARSGEQPPARSAAATRERSGARGSGGRRVQLPRIPIDTDAPQIAALDELRELSVPVARPRDLDLPGLGVHDVTIAPLEPDQKERR